MTRLRKTPIAYYGGKQMMLRHILPLIPPHKKYTETYFGGGALFFAKEPSQFEVINDTNAEAINFYKVLQTEYYKLHMLIVTTLHSREQYEDAMHVYARPHMFDEIRRAWAFWIATQMGFSSQIGSWAVDKSDNSVAKKLDNKKKVFGEDLKERLERVQIECNDANYIIKQHDSPDTFHYIDPPYFNSDCGHYKGYSEADFEKQLITLTTLQGKFLLSNYPSQILEKYVVDNNWHVQRIHKKVAVSHKSKKEKVEVLVANYPI